MPKKPSSLPADSLAAGTALADTVATQLMAFAQSTLAFHKAEGREPVTKFYGTNWGQRRRISSWTAVPEAYDSAIVDYGMIPDTGNFHIPSPSAHAKLHAETLRPEMRGRLVEVVRTMRKGLHLLGGRTTFFIQVVCDKDMDNPSLTLAIDGIDVQNHTTPVFLPGLKKRLAPVFAGLHALEQAMPAEQRSTSLWGWEEQTLRIAAPSAVHAWFKTLILRAPHAPFTNDRSYVGLKAPVLYLDADKVADGIADVRRALCPTGSPYP